MHVSFTKIKLAILAMLIAFSIKAQHSCSTATTFGFPINNSITEYHDTVYWFKVVLNKSHYTFNIPSNSGRHKIMSATTYTGSCGSLTLIQKDSSTYYNDSLITIDIFNPDSNVTFVVKLNTQDTSSVFKVQLITALDIIGNSGNCSGSAIILGAEEYGAVGTPTYTWSSNAGSVNTQTVSVSPTSTTVYTVTATDAQGGVYPVQTCTVYPLPAASCTSCAIVQNSGFDNNSSCPTAAGQTALSYPWSGSSTDYYNSCTTYPYVGVPGNSYGYELDHTSGTTTGSYQGFIAYENPYNTPNGEREYFMQQLKCTLIAGQSYNVSFWASAGDYCSDLCNIGLAMTQNIFMPSTSTLPQPVTPQVVSTTPVGSTGWTQVQLQNYIANNEQFITIGNFNNNAGCGAIANTSASGSPLSGGYIFPRAYYFIDDVSITPNTPTVTASSYTVNCATPSTLTLTATGAANAYTSWTNGVNTYTGAVVYVPSPTGNITYTCSVNLPCSGCTPVTQTLSIYTTGTPTINISASTNYVCPGYSATLTASGATTYTWSTSATTNSIVVTPTVATTYSVIGTNSGGCTNNAVVTIGIASTPTITSVSSPTLVCSGSSTSSTLTASGSASTYTWSSNAGGVHTTTVVVTPTVTSTYTINGTGSNGCIGTNTTSVIVSPTPTITLGGKGFYSTICQGTGAYIVASGASSYTWTPSSTISAPYSATVTASPTVTTTYTVNGVSSTGCPASATVAITVITTSCTGSPIPTYSPTSSYTLNTYPTYYMSSNLIIPAHVNYVISNTEVRMAAGVSINVANTGTLTVVGGWLHACAEACSGSEWQGIVLQNGATLNMNSYNIVEDALQAVYTQSNSTTYPVTSWSITNTIFNKNDIGMSIDQTACNFSPNTITSNIFTCRNLSNHSTTSTNFTNIFNDIKAATPILTSSVNPTSFTPSGSRTAYGIYIYSAGLSTPFNIGSGTSGTNLFDNLDFGIHSLFTTLTIKNNIFQNLTGNSNGGNYVGVGIYAESRGSAAASQLTIGNSSTTINNAETNYFKNCLVGIYAPNQLKVAICNNKFDIETTATTFTNSGTYVTGQHGIRLLDYAQGSSTVTAETMVLANNTINNYNTGLFLDFDKLYNTSGSGSVISSNTITAVGSSSQFCNYGIWAGQGSSNGGNAGVGLTGVEITGNSITNISTNCIYGTNINSISGATSGIFDIQQNTELSVKANTYTTIPSQRVAAVYLTNCWYSRVSDNTNIRATGYTGTSVPTGQYMAGVYLYQCPHSAVNCNTVSNIGECFVWESTSPTYTLNNSGWQRNSLDYSRYGLVLRNTGVMGVQGASTSQIGTIWGASAHFPGAQTLTDVSFPDLSPYTKLYESGTTCTGTPCGNVTSGGHVFSTTGTTPTLLTGSAVTSLVCASDGTHGGGGSGRLAQVDTTGTHDSLRVYLTNILANNSPIPLYDYETRWAMRHQVFSLMPNLSVPNHGYENAKTFAAIDNSFATGDFNTAQNVLNGVTPTNTIEQNWKQIDNLIIKLQTDTLNSGDVATLQSVANQCPLTGSSIVWKARVLLNKHFNTEIEYPDYCASNSNNNVRLTNTTGINELSNGIQTVSLYPNPNDGKMTMDYNILSDAELRITDITGKLISVNKLNASEKTININIESLFNGVYLYTVINQQGIVKTGRIVIIK